MLKKSGDIIWILWHGVWPSHQQYRWIRCGHTFKGQYQVVFGVNDAQLAQRGPKCTMKTSPTTETGRMDSCFHVVHARFSPYHLNVADDAFFYLLLSSFGEPVQAVASLCCSSIVVFCSYIPFVSWLYVQECSSAYVYLKSPVDHQANDCIHCIPAYLSLDAKAHIPAGGRSYKQLPPFWCLLSFSFLNFSGS